MSPLDARPAMFLAYSLLFSLGVVLTAPYYLWRLRGRILSRAAWRERFGFLPASFQQPEAGAIWIHAVSVGETLAVVGLVRKLQQRHPNRTVFMSHVTPAGREAGEARLPGLTGRFFLPLDWRWSVRRALERIRPGVLLIAETELWPNLLRTARESGARIVLVNARLSDRSFRRYRLVRPFARRFLGYVDRICVQTETDAERFRALGAPEDRVAVAGNMKFDATPPPAGELTSLLENALRLAQREPVIVAASTMPGEEAMLLPVWTEVRRRHPRALLILAPRHSPRFATVANLLLQGGWSFVPRTLLKSDIHEVAAQIGPAEIVLLDTIGELGGIFGLADIVFVGGSLVPTGGHNVLEPAYWAKPIVFGPHMENFRDIARLFLEGRAAWQARDPQVLGGMILELLADPARRREMGEKARHILERESGATERVLDQLQAWLDVGAAAPAKK